MVFDDGDQELPGAQVTIESEVLIGGVRTAVAGAGGSFQFPALPPGIYKVSLAMDGFVTQELENIKVTLDQTTDLRVQLRPSCRPASTITSTSSASSPGRCPRGGG